MLRYNFPKYVFTLLLLNILIPTPYMDGANNKKKPYILWEASFSIIQIFVDGILDLSRSYRKKL